MTAEYKIVGTVSPRVPQRFVSDEDIRILSRFGLMLGDAKDGSVMIYSLGTISFYPGEEEEKGPLSPSDLDQVLQRIVERSQGEIPYIYLSYSEYCTEIRQDSFGGGAILVTAEGAQWINVRNWLDSRIEEIEKS